MRAFVPTQVELKQRPGLDTSPNERHGRTTNKTRQGRRGSDSEAPGEKCWQRGASLDEHQPSICPLQPAAQSGRPRAQPGRSQGLCTNNRRTPNMSRTAVTGLPLGAADRNRRVTLLAPEIRNRNKTLRTQPNGPSGYRAPQPACPTGSEACSMPDVEPAANGDPAMLLLHLPAATRPPPHVKHQEINTLLKLEKVWRPLPSKLTRRRPRRAPPSVPGERAFGRADRHSKRSAQEHRKPDYIGSLLLFFGPAGLQRLDELGERRTSARRPLAVATGAGGVGAVRHERHTSPHRTGGEVPPS